MSELWPGGPQYEGGDAFPITTDSVLLADFVRLKPGARVLELGCGAGLISLLLLEREPRLNVHCVELDSSAAQSAQRNFAANGHAVAVKCGDLRESANLPEANFCDIVVCNPPYFPGGRGKRAGDPRRAAARSEGECTLEEIVRAAARSLKQGGRLCLVHRASRLAEVFSELSRQRMEPKRLRLVQHTAQSAPSVILCEAARFAAPGLELEPTLILRGEDGRDSAEVRRIYHLGG